MRNVPTYYKSCSADFGLDNFEMLNYAIYFRIVRTTEACLQTSSAELYRGTLQLTADGNVHLGGHHLAFPNPVE